MWQPCAISAVEKVLVSPQGSQEDFLEEVVTIVQHK